MKEKKSLTQEQFEYIIEQCDAVLAKYPSDIFINGNAWLHVLHSHPSIQDRYIDVFYQQGFITVCKNSIRRTAVLVSDLLSSITDVFKKQHTWKMVSSDTDILFISHLLNADTPKDAPDFYFQDLPIHLQKENHRVAIGLMNHVKGFKGWNGSNTLPGSYPQKFLLPQQLGFKSEVKLLTGALKRTFLFFKEYLRENDPLKKSFLFELTASTLSPHTFRAYRIYKTVQSLINHSGIKVVSLTWEGHSWEKMVCLACRSVSHKVLCIGYQHTILFPSSYALKRSPGTLYNPDIILTVGAITKKILKDSPDLKAVKILEYGSPRLSENNSSVMNQHIRNGCLVAPEGLVNECLILFPFAIAAAKLLPDIHFIFRTHPSIRFADLALIDKSLQNLPPNIIISSNKNINDDFAKSSWLLYRNSSVSFFAIQSGLRPLYVRVENEISNDVLYELNSWRLMISTPDEMVGIVHQDKHSSEKERSLEREEAVCYSKAYMMPYKVSVFDECIAEIFD